MMKGSQKDLAEKLSTPRSQPSSTRALLPKLMVWLLLFVCLTYLVYTLKLISTPPSCLNDGSNTIIDHSKLEFHPNISITTANANQLQQIEQIPVPVHLSQLNLARSALQLNDIVFGIAASANLWDQRKNYIKIWYTPNDTRAIVWLDKPVREHRLASPDRSLPPLKISADTSQFAYKNRQGHRSAIRISRIVSETFNLSLPGVRWFVMGDDDTVFIPDNLVRVLSKFDDTQYWYIGSLSESHLQNIYFSYGMAYGGGGFAISYPLAKALYRIHDKCISRYPALYGSDDRMHACMAELGVPLTKHLGFHQYDVYGNLFGLLAAHPVTPLVTLHHLDVVEPIFPNMTRVQALNKLMVPMRLDSAGLMQQSVCYEKHNMWTISVSWGFAVQIIRGVLSAREMEMPTRTFLNWYRRADYTAYAFNTRPVARNPCQKPYVFYMETARFDRSSNQTVSDYVRHRVPHPECKWNMADPAVVERIRVFKKPDPHLWDKSPRRNCCRVLPSKKKNIMVIDVGICREGEISEVQ